MERDKAMDIRLCFIFLLFWALTSSAIVVKPFFGQHEDSVSLVSVSTERLEPAGWHVKVTFRASSTPQLLWEVDGQAVLNYDRRYVSMSRYDSASLSGRETGDDPRVRLSVVLGLFQETVTVRPARGSTGLHPVSNHSLTLTPSETLTFSPSDEGNIHVGARLWVDDAARFPILKLQGLLMLPDYCSRPVRALLARSSSSPHLMTAQPLERSDRNNSLSTRFHITSVSKPAQKQGMLVIRSEFATGSHDASVERVDTVRRLFFKPAPHFQDFIIRNTVMFVGWTPDIIADSYKDVDVSVYAIGNPTPRIMLAKNGVDVSTMVERRDIEETYFKHAILRFRNVSQSDSGRYICTAMAGDGRSKQTFTLYVRAPCTV